MRCVGDALLVSMLHTGLGANANNLPDGGAVQSFSLGVATVCPCKTGISPTGSSLIIRSRCVSAAVERTRAALQTRPAAWGKTAEGDEQLRVRIDCVSPRQTHPLSLAFSAGPAG